VTVTVIAAFGAGAFGAMPMSWNDRQERFRDRMLDAADGFSAAVAEALVVGTAGRCGRGKRRGCGACESGR
jgi:hypothetical protein